MRWPLLALFGLMLGTAPAARVVDDRPVPAAPLAEVQVERPAGVGIAGEGSAEDEAWTARIEAVGATCDLPAETACGDRGCVSLLEVPRLDGPLGWLEMGRRSPRLVAAVLAGDLGLPDGILPCRQAIRGLAGTQTLARATPQGEVWCVVGSATAETRSLCDQLAGRRGQSPGFAHGEDRVVELRPPGT